MAEPRGVPYGFEQRLPGTTFDAAVERITAALQKEGFGVLTKIDVKDTLTSIVDDAERRLRRVMAALVTA